MKFYKFTVEISVLVGAEDEDSAVEQATGYYSNIDGGDLVAEADIQEVARSKIHSEELVIVPNAEGDWDLVPMKSVKAP